MDSPILLAIIIFVAVMLPVTFLVSLFHLKNRNDYLVIKKELEELKNLVNGEKILYEGAIMLNPFGRIFYFLKKQKNVMVITEKEILINTNPITRIKSDDIKDVKFNASVNFWITNSPITIIKKNDEYINIFSAYQHYKMYDRSNVVDHDTLARIIQSIVKEHPLDGN